MNDSARVALSELIARYGATLADDPRRVAALLRDLAGEHPLEISLIETAAEEGISTDLRDAPTADLATRLEQLARQLQRRRALTPEAARWAVESWAAALHPAASVESSATALHPAAPVERPAGAERPVEIEPPVERERPVRPERRGARRRSVVRLLDPRAVVGAAAAGSGVVVFSLFLPYFQRGGGSSGWSFAAWDFVLVVLALLSFALVAARFRFGADPTVVAASWIASWAVLSTYLLVGGLGEDFTSGLRGGFYVGLVGAVLTVAASTAAAASATHIVGGQRRMLVILAPLGGVVAIASTFLAYSEDVNAWRLLPRWDWIIVALSAVSAVAAVWAGLRRSRVALFASLAAGAVVLQTCAFVLLEAPLFAGLFEGPAFEGGPAAGIIGALALLNGALALLARQSEVPAEAAPGLSGAARRADRGTLLLGASTVIAVGLVIAWLVLPGGALDSRAPRVDEGESSAQDIDGDSTIYVTFDEDLGDPGGPLDRNLFSVSVNGSPTNVPQYEVLVLDGTVAIPVDRDLNGGDRVEVSYSPARSSGVESIEDEAGNKASPFTLNLTAGEDLRF